MLLLRYCCEAQAVATAVVGEIDISFDVLKQRLQMLRWRILIVALYNR